MRSPFLFAVVGAALSAQPAPAAAASVSGSFDIRLGGDPARCLAVRLVPRTPDSEREFAAYFGTLGASFRQLSHEDLLRARRDAASDDVQAIGCTEGHWFTGYRFAHVAPGRYFLTALAQSSLRTMLGPEPGATGSGLQTGPRESTVYLMRPVTVASSNVDIRLNLTNN